MVSGKGRRGETDRERATSPLLSTFSLQVFQKFSYSRKVLRSPVDQSSKGLLFRNGKNSLVNSDPRGGKLLLLLFLFAL